MSVTATQSNAVVHELWRVADSGDVDALGQLFARGANVNARNKHGMTALMRAARNGHAKMVRALLERGADPNLARNDKFTALALAAFFGHTETVRILVEHGAKTNAVTRCGTSPQTWATRRTFVEAARCLEPHAPAPVPAPVAPARVPARAAAPVIKTLKDPPEIWDLVHEVPRGFDAGSAFISRLKSMRTSLALRIAGVGVVSTACIVGVLVLRGSQAHSLSADEPATQNVVASEVSAPANIESPKSEAPVAPVAPAANEFSNHSKASSDNDKPAPKVVLTRLTRSRTAREEVIPVVQSREAPAAPAVPVVAAPKVEAPRQANKPNSGLSPQLIAPAKSSTPKAKVIQWP